MTKLSENRTKHDKEKEEYTRSVQEKRKIIETQKHKTPIGTITTTDNRSVYSIYFFPGDQSRLSLSSLIGRMGCLCNFYACGSSYVRL